MYRQDKVRQGRLEKKENLVSNSFTYEYVWES